MAVMAWLHPWRHLVVRMLAFSLCAVLALVAGQQPALAQTPSDVQSPAALVPRSFVATAVEKVGDAVVRIDTEKTIVRETPDLFFDDPFFRGFMGPNGFPSYPQEQLLRGQGSGFIISEDGDVLTNSHVVNGADRVTITLKDGRSFEGIVEGEDSVTDLAVVRIDAGDNELLPIATLGDSDDVQVGDWAIAVGNPLGLDNTVTLGIVSTLKRSSASVGIPDKRLDFIQTDAAINPGNSGGPLLNQGGQVIGINTAIRADAMGIGFAIPINKAKEIKDQLVRGETIAHPYLGVQIATLTPDIARRNNEDPNAGIILPEVEGVLVIRVIPKTPADQAGLRRGDIVLEIDGQPIASADVLQRKVENSTVGQTLNLKVQRGSQIEQLNVTAAELDNGN